MPRSLPGRIAIAGVAWAQHRGIDKVEVRVDGGAWAEARLADVDTIDTWRQWVLDWDATPGRHALEVRATDATGAVQPEDARDALPRGGDRLALGRHHGDLSGHTHVARASRAGRSTKPTAPGFDRVHKHRREPREQAHSHRGLCRPPHGRRLRRSLLQRGRDDRSGAPTRSTTARASMAPMAPSMAAPSASAAMMDGTTFGAACSAVPATGAGSFAGHGHGPVATAASNNPVLSTLVTAVTAAKLGDTLNGAKDITVFAPTNDAFAAMDKATLDSAMADPSGLLSKVLTYHVVQGRLTPEMLAGTHKTLNGADLTVEGSGAGLHGQRQGHGRLRQRPDRQRHRLHHRRRPPPAGELISGPVAPGGTRPRREADEGRIPDQHRWHRVRPSSVDLVCVTDGQ